MSKRGKTRHGVLVPIKKEGAHGTLYRYIVRYTPDPEMAPVYEWPCWAYSAEHAAMRFDESNEDEGYERVGEPERVYTHPNNLRPPTD